MDIPTAKELLAGTKRHVLRDDAFGDAEVEWIRDGEIIATGYFGNNCAEVYFHRAADKFTDDDAWAFRGCGTLGAISLNNEN